MSIDNKAAATRIVWIIIFAKIAMLSSLILCILFRISHIAVYTIIIVFIILLVIKMLTMKYFKLEITEDLISVKYDHPLVKRYRSASLELPWYKVSFCQLEKNTFYHYITVGVRGRAKNKTFDYNLGLLSKKSIERINEGLKAAKDNQNNRI